MTKEFAQWRTSERIGKSHLAKIVVEVVIMFLCTETTNYHWGSIITYTYNEKYINVLHITCMCHAVTS